MENELDSIFENIYMAAADAAAANDKWLVIDCTYRYVEDWPHYDYQEVLARILAVIEHFPELDYGGPGPFGEFIETQPIGAYAYQLAQSLQRRPSVQVLGWLDRTMRVDASVREAQGGLEDEEFIEVLTEVLEHPLASESCKAFARMCLDG
jgi:hypothetical protein